MSTNSNFEVTESQEFILSVIASNSPIYGRQSLLGYLYKSAPDSVQSGFERTENGVYHSELVRGYRELTRTGLIREDAVSRDGTRTLEITLTPQGSTVTAR